MTRRLPAAGSLGRRARRRRGMAMVEFVMVLPALLVILFGILEFGVLFYQWLTLSNAAREGARAAVVYRKTCDAALVKSLVEQTVIGYAGSAHVDLAASDIDVTGQCAGRGTPVRVEVSHDFNLQVLPGFLASLSPTIPLVGTFQMRNEGSS